MGFSRFFYVSYSSTYYNFIIFYRTPYSVKHKLLLSLILIPYFLLRLKALFYTTIKKFTIRIIIITYPLTTGNLTSDSSSNRTNLGQERSRTLHK